MKNVFLAVVVGFILSSCGQIEEGTSFNEQTASAFSKAPTASSEGSRNAWGLGYPVCVVGRVTKRAEMFVYVTGQTVAGGCGFSRSTGACTLNAFMYAGPFVPWLVSVRIGATVGICAQPTVIGNRVGYQAYHFAIYN